MRSRNLSFFQYRFAIVANLQIFWFEYPTDYTTDIEHRQIHTPKYIYMLIYRSKSALKRGLDTHLGS